MFLACARVFFRKTEIKIFNLLIFIGIDIVQTTMSVSTQYLIPFSSYMQKTKQDLVFRKNTHARTENMFGFLHIT